jgi:hypothetical protein
MSPELARGRTLDDDPGVSFHAKWSVGSVVFGGLLIAAFGLHSLSLVVVAGAGIAVFGLALSADYRGLATAVRRAQWRLGQSAQTYRLVGRGITLIGLLWIAAALAKTT